ncbi:MAG: HAMP domain-containing protein [Planctomycetia bacterium]|nr:HAMP domain-containing protein [Planctomycetia bacterium]
MWRSRIFWKLFGASALLIALSATVFVFVVTPWQVRQTEEQIAKRLRDVSIVLEGRTGPLVESRDSSQLQALVAELRKHSELRYTIIAADGAVLADSDHDPQTMENHARREEFAAALAGRESTFRRHSPTLGIPMLYHARPVGPTHRPIGAVRVAIPVAQIDRDVAATRQTIALVALVTGLVALAVSYFLVWRVVRPVSRLTTAAQAIARGDYNYDAEVYSRDEFGALAASFAQVGRQLAGRLDDVLRQAQYLHTVLGGMVEGVVAIDPERRIVLANPAACALLDYDGAVPTGRPLYELVRHPSIDQAIDDALAGREPPHCQFDLTRTTRKTLALHVGRLPGEPCPGLVFVLYDVTELRRLERMRQDFIANVSHELKTPLSSIKAYSETLLGGALHDSEHNVHFLERIHRQALRLERIVGDMLSLSRIESGQAPLEIVPVSLDEIVAEAMTLHTPLAQAQGIELSSQPPEQPVSVLGDEEGLREILDNLLNNAVKYTPAGGKVVVRWRRNGDEAALEVEDTGVGIAPADQERIFERFYRVDRARSRELGGTGLGLSIVKHLAQSFGGSVAVQSELGKGSVFTVTLRASDHESPPRTNDETLDAVDGTPRPTRVRLDD